MNRNISTALHYLGKYINGHKDVKRMGDGEWMTFSVVVRKKFPGVIQFSNPCLTGGVVNTDEVKPDDNVVILNEFNYGEN